MVLDGRHIEAIYRLSHGQGWSVRKIARHLKVSRKSVRKYLAQPAPAPVQRTRASKLDPYKERIGQLLEEDPSASAVVITQRLREQGYEGGITILREYLKGVRPGRSPRAFVRVESAPGERFEVDWGHFGALDYQGDKRKLYAFVLVECHSRRLYLEFTHSQSFETFARCHIHAFRFMQGVAREVLFDNLASAVAEREGRWVRFNPRFLELARQYGFFPRACTPGSPWEKGKVEKLLGYVRQNFWPLRSFTGLADVNHQARRPGRQPTASSRDPRAAPGPFSASGLAASARAGLRLPRDRPPPGAQGSEALLRRQSLLRPGPLGGKAPDPQSRFRFGQPL